LTDPLEEEFADEIKRNLPDNYKVETKRIENPTAKDLEEIQNDESKLNYILIKAKDVAGGDHWVQGTGTYTDSDGSTYLEYSGTSQNDQNKNREFTIDAVPEGTTNVFQATTIEVYSILPM